MEARKQFARVGSLHLLPGRRLRSSGLVADALTQPSHQPRLFFGKKKKKMSQSGRFEERVGDGGRKHLVRKHLGMAVSWVIHLESFV